MAKIGRNDPCTCGSGRKYKRCCQGADGGGTRNRLMLMAVGAVVLIALAAGFAAVSNEKAVAGVRVWSAEHGHYHDANGVATP